MFLFVVIHIEELKLHHKLSFFFTHLWWPQDIQGMFTTSKG